MNQKKLKHINRKLTDEERARHAEIRKAVESEFPPKQGSGKSPAPFGLPARIREAREAKGLTWYALAKAAGIPDQATIRDLENGKDISLSSMQSVAKVLGLQLELVEYQV